MHWENVDTFTVSWLPQGKEFHLWKRESVALLYIFQFTTKPMRFATRKVCVKPEAHIVGTYPSFCNMTECLGVFLFPLDGVLVHCIIPPLDSQQHYICLCPRLYPFIHLSGKGQCGRKVSCPKTQHNVPRQSLNPDQSIWALPLRPQRLQDW